MFKKINNPLFICFFQIIVVLAVFQFFIKFVIEKPDPYNFNKAEEPIRQQIYNIVDDCGEGYPVFWFVMQTDKNKDNFMIKSISEKGESCNGPLTQCNERYKGIFKLDPKTKAFLASIESGQVIYYNNVKDLPKFPSIQGVITLAEKPIHSLGIVLVKNLQNNLIYLFSLSKTNSNSSCSKDHIIKHLDNLGKIARGGV